MNNSIAVDEWQLKYVNSLVNILKTELSMFFIENRYKEIL